MIINLKEFPTTIEGKEPDVIWFDGGYYVGIVDRGDSFAMYKWDGIADVWIERFTFDKVRLPEKIGINIDPEGF